ncbi:prolipoprotein diacylglyceryl transferase [Asaccharospora irregularis]|uniref:Phosphatidylglycerol--prolipoprotein diacylglyceryl transferase n=1 Tax=Asaccharospora irregularis DSM 2635 TaxID=1121321 RepID=A0A1M5KA27_9FIRM|nr:prolipoprotein diacylglyceryl transferase [Asaccharospora irregularis]SHG49043.1 phosphatidylglycerol:prolipoprotein diacylglycerol transferase [Asaccharospora irregularis DSM 2635]
MVELFKIGGISIYLFGVAVSIAMAVGIFVMLREAKRKGLNEDSMWDLSIYTIIASVIGARLYYILVFDLSNYINNPIEIFQIQNGGMSIQGGILGGIIFAIWYTRKKKISFLKAADAFAPGIILGQAIGRVGCDVFGIPMKSQYLWGIMVNNQLLHPAQIYEMILDLILFIYLWRKREKIQYHGQLFIHYLIGFALNRALIEFVRENPIVFGSLTVAHVTSFVIIVVAIIAGNKIKNHSKVLDEERKNISSKELYLGYAISGFILVVGTWIYYIVH